MPDKQGFTLIEILIALVIVGILASLAASSFVSQGVKSYAQEAYLILANTREAATVYYFDPYKGNGDYVGMTINNLTFDPNAALAGQNRHFNYDFQVVNEQDYVARATCVAAGCGVDDYIEVNQNGVIVPNPAGKFA